MKCCICSLDGKGEKRLSKERNSARSAVTNLHSSPFLDLSTDVYEDALFRQKGGKKHSILYIIRIGYIHHTELLCIVDVKDEALVAKTPSSSNDARQNISEARQASKEQIHLLSKSKFRDLVSDVAFNWEKRYPILLSCYSKHFKTAHESRLLEKMKDIDQKYKDSQSALKSLNSMNLELDVALKTKTKENELLRNTIRMLENEVNLNQYLIYTYI
jgi:hypothetical protein